MDLNGEIAACIPRLRRYARALVGDGGAADDLVQDTLERAWSKIHLWQRGAALRPWLFGIMHNLHIDQLRRRHGATVSLDELDVEIPVRATQDDMSDMHDLQGALRLLPLEQREVLLLVAVEQMTYKDAARALGIPPGTLMSRLARGRERLRTLLEGRSQIVPLKVVK
ncbi:MAG: RNA polymerase sigma factor [Pseudomonadota bacterium]